MRNALLIAGIALASCAPEETATAPTQVAGPAQGATSGPPGREDVFPLAQARIRELLQNPEGLTFTDTEIYPGGGPLWIVCGRYNRDGTAYRYVYIGGMAMYLEPQDSAARLDNARADYCPPR